MFKEVKTGNLQDKIEKMPSKSRSNNQEANQADVLGGFEPCFRRQADFSGLKTRRFFHVEIETKAQKLKY